MRPMPALLSLLATTALAQQPVDAAASRLQLLVDNFHRAMPQDPSSLRDAKVRQQCAAAAIPAIRELETWLLARADREAGNAVRAAELGVYGLLLGDDRYRTPAEPLRTAAAALITADAAHREAALGAFGDALTAAAAPPQTANGTALAVVRAAGLQAAEAEALALRAAAIAPVRELFAAEAARRRADVRSRLDQPLTLTGKLRDGSAFSTAELRGKVVVVDFWASWCAPCKRLLPELVALQQKFAGRGLEIVGVSCDRDTAALDEFLRAHSEVDWRQLYDADKPGWHALATSLGITAIPRLLLIDRGGVLRGVDPGEHLAEQVEKLLARRD